MRNTIRFWFRRVIFRRRVPLVGAVEWTAVNQGELAVFLGTETGRKLRQALVAQIAVENERAAMEGTALACGRAQGYRALWGVWESFANFAEPAGAQAEPGANASATRGPGAFTLPAGLAHLEA